MTRPGGVHRGFRFARGAVTLIEVVLSMGILVFLSSMTYWFYSSALETSRRGTDVARRTRLMRVVLERMTTEIRQASAITADYRVGIHGEAERISILTYRVPSRDQVRERTLSGLPRPAEYDLAQVEYSISRHPEILHEDGYEFPIGLFRVERLIPRRVSAPTDPGATSVDDRRLDESEDRGDVSLGPDIEWESLYAPEIRYLRFCYFDGHTWWDTWAVSGDNPLPQLVQVTIGTDTRPPLDEEAGRDEINEEFCECLNEDPVDCERLGRDQLSIVVRVSQADPTFGSRWTREIQGLVDGLSAQEEQP